MSTGGASTADKIKYDNTESGLQSTNVQGAVDELNNSLTYYDEETDTLYINSGNSNYTYDSSTEILYFG